MRFPAWIKRSANWAGEKQKSLVITLVVVAALALASPLGSPGGIGLRGEPSVVKKTVKQLSENETEEVTTTEDSGKTVWDWLSLLGVPLSLFALGALFQIAQQQQAAAAAKEQREQATSEAAEEVLQIYFDRISALLVDKNLLGIATKENISSEQKEFLCAAVDVIRARTLSILRRFTNSQERKTSVIRFLIETEVIAKLELNLSGADLGGAYLRSTKLIGVNLSGADLFGADLIDTDLINTDLSMAKLRDADLRIAKLSDADLRGADLCGADLSSADLLGAKLSYAKLRDAYLRGTKLIGADLRGAKLIGADLSCAKLNGANLINTDLSLAKLSLADMNGAKLSYAKLNGADLFGANLSGAKGLTKQQLEQAVLCQTQLPEGIDLNPNRDCK